MIISIYFGADTWIFCWDRWCRLRLGGLCLRQDLLIIGAVSTCVTTSWFDFLRHVKSFSFGWTSALSSMVFSSSSIRHVEDMWPTWFLGYRYIFNHFNPWGKSSMTLLVFTSWTPYVIPLILPVYFIFFKKKLQPICFLLWSLLVGIPCHGVPQG